MVSNVAVHRYSSAGLLSWFAMGSGGQNRQWDGGIAGSRHMLACSSVLPQTSGMRRPFVRKLVARDARVRLHSLQADVDSKCPNYDAQVVWPVITSCHCKTRQEPLLYEASKQLHFGLGGSLNTTPIIYTLLALRLSTLFVSWQLLI
jgi:hypothetical protein